MRLKLITALLVCFAVLAGCQTTDATLHQQGHSDAYVIGFHDGRHSGMQEAGNFLEHFIQDTQRFENDPEYHAGWIAGEAEGRRVQQQANVAVGIYSSYEIGKEADKATDFQKIGRKAVKDVDTSSLKSLENN